MRFLLLGLVSGTLVLAVACTGMAQQPAASAPASSGAPAGPGESPHSTWKELKVRLPDSAPPGPGEAPRGSGPVPPASGVAICLAEIESLRAREATLQAHAPDEDLKKKIEILEKQIETLENLVKLLAKQIEKQPAGGAAVEQLQAQGATLEARTVQAARRDVELAGAVDDIREHMDAQERYGPELPAPLKELFLPSGNSETQLSIYGALAFGYSKILGDPTTAANGAGRPSTPGGFYFGEFTPDFLLKLNDWIFLEAEIGIGADGSVSAGSFAQADFFVNDSLTIIAGRFVAPIGFYNERLNNPWINKLPGDAPGSGPLLWQQVLPPLAMLGVQATGACYIGCSPIKMEYAAYVSNGLNLTPATAGAPTIDELANLENMTDTFNIITNSKAVGGRLGFWWPEAGLETGFSALYNGHYIAGGIPDSMSLWAVDLNYHKGNWDARLEYGMTHQQAQPFLGADITRQGFYGQVAYRPRDSHNRYLQNIELVYRYAYVNFSGIDPTTLDLTTYSTPMDVPTRRQQNEIGINYYFYPRMSLKCAYQINDEPGFHLHDNQFLTELAWGW
jgi:hypothetical protein